MTVKCKALKAFKVVINNDLRTFSNGETIMLEQQDAERLVHVGLMAIVSDPPFAAVKIVGKPKVRKKAVKRDNN